MKYHRYLEAFINKTCFPSNKMAFVSGPRQCGKTTMAKMMLKERESGNYYSWDEVKFRRQWKIDPNALLPVPQENQIKPLVIFDELHKAKLWKRDLKGLYDT